MRFERIGKQVLLDGAKVRPSALEEVCKKYFSASSWEKLWQDIEKYGRVHVAFVFVDSKRKGD